VEGLAPPSQTVFHNPPEVFTPSSFLICSAISAQLKRVQPRDRQTDRLRYSGTDVAIIGNNSLRLMHSMQPKNAIDTTNTGLSITAWMIRPIFIFLLYAINILCYVRFSSTRVHYGTRYNFRQFYWNIEIACHNECRLKLHRNNYPKYHHAFESENRKINIP